MAARTALSCPHDALRGITRQLLALEVGSMSVAARSFATSSRRREEAASAAAVAGEQSPTASTSSASASKPDFAAILNGPASSSSTPDRQIVDFPTSTTSFRPQRSRSAGQSNRSPYSPSRLHPVAPYRLHAHCTKHNTILSLTKDLPDELQKYLENKNVEGAFNAMQSGKGVSEDSIDPKILGQTVLRVSPGLLGLKKAQRGTFEAASRASVQMFNLIAQLG